MKRSVLPLQRVDGTPAEMTDAALVAACVTGDRAALGALFDRHHDLVRRFIARSCGWDARDVDDLVQGTFVAVIAAARSFDGRAAVKTWLCGIAINVMRHHARSEVRRRRLAEVAAAQPRPPGPDIEHAQVERERSAQLAAAIANLSPKLRDAFVLVYLEGLPGTDVAAVLGISEGAIWKRLHEARTQLRVALEGASQ